MKRFREPCLRQADCPGFLCGPYTAPPRSPALASSLGLTDRSHPYIQPKTRTRPRRQSLDYGRVTRVRLRVLVVRMRDFSLDAVVTQTEHPVFHCCSPPPRPMETSHIMALDILASAARIQAAFSSVVLCRPLRSRMLWPAASEIPNLPVTACVISSP